MSQCGICDGKYPRDTIFVFGSNLGGRHGAGAAHHAKSFHGARQWHAHGLVGRSYGIPTKDKNLKVLGLYEIEFHVHMFVDFTLKNPGELFFLTAVGCGLAGYLPEAIAPYFKGITSNVIVPQEFEPFIER